MKSPLGVGRLTTKRKITQKALSSHPIPAKDVSNPTSSGVLPNLTTAHNTTLPQHISVHPNRHAQRDRHNPPSTKRDTQPAKVGAPTNTGWIVLRARRMPVPNSTDRRMQYHGSRYFKAYRQSPPIHMIVTSTERTESTNEIMSVHTS